MPLPPPLFTGLPRPGPAQVTAPSLLSSMPTHTVAACWDLVPFGPSVYLSISLYVHSSDCSSQNAARSYLSSSPSFT